MEDFSIKLVNKAFEKEFSLLLENGFEAGTRLNTLFAGENTEETMSGILENVFHLGET